MSSPAPLVIPPRVARRFHRRALLLDQPAPDIATALDHHGYVQIDPINVCGRMHDLILRNRVAGYREGGLMRHLHGEGTPLPARQRKAFEHHLPNSNILVAFPLDAWPHLLAAMKDRSRTHGPWSGKLTPREKTLATHILAELATRGPLSSEDIDDTRRARGVWGAATLAKTTLQKLFFHGRVLISHRVAQRRLYQLPEHVLPASVLVSRASNADETTRWLALLKLRQRRLALLKRDELRAVADVVQPVLVENCPPLYCLRQDVPLLMECLSENTATRSPSTNSASESLLLAPLDPLIYDRRVTHALWNFDYTWEVYTPAQRRVRGYYALPLLVAEEIAGHVDPKADRVNRRLVVVNRFVRRGHRASPAIKSLAAFLGLRA